MNANDTCSDGDSEDDLDVSTFEDIFTASLFAVADTVKNVNCSGTPLSLYKRCNTDNILTPPCNYHPHDPDRNDAQYSSSYMDICYDQSTCVRETKVCRGVPLCPNHLDLKWCKNASIWNKPADWKPLRGG